MTHLYKFVQSLSWPWCFFLIILFSSPISYGNENIFSIAKNILGINQPQIEVIYNDDAVISVCPSGSVGCFSSEGNGKIILKNTLPEAHHDVVLFGLYADYLQYKNSRTINSLYTCEQKVKFLEYNDEKRLANLYEGQCNTLFKGQILVLN
tara:strand:+ start:222 stop:674 length:453 start_codon:yes stop_codon:yes gene_type:complete